MTRRKYRLKKWIIVAILALVLSLAIAIITITIVQENRSLHPEDRERAKQRLTNIGRKITLPGKLVYNEIKDSGCQGYIAGLEKSTSCTYDLVKYFKNDQSLEKDLRKAEELILSLGWRKAESNYGYYKKNSPIIYLASHPKLEEYSSIPDSFFQQENIVLEKNEYVYGIRISSAYWGCKEGVTTVLLCPPPFIRK